MKVIKGEFVHIEDARALEAKEDYQAAAGIYEKLLKLSPGNLPVVHRLLVLFRKLGNAQKEMQYIDAAIKIHEQKYRISNQLDKKATSLSNQLNKMLGHTDKKGKPVFVADEILKLELRKTRLLKKMG
jgi:tetratricopeptide (TPR) repeat protein